jgi:phage terminase large subunit
MTKPNRQPSQGPNNGDPVEFAHNVLGLKLWSKQRQILRAVEHNRRVAVKAAHSTGKTKAAAAVALWFAAKFARSRVLTLAPGWIGVRTILWFEIHSLLNGARYRLPTTVENQTEVRIGHDSVILGLSTNDESRLRGHHAEHGVLIIADEATGIDSDFWPTVEGILAGGTNSKLLLLGNPTVSSSGNYFADAFGRNRASWATISISAFESPNLAGMSLERLLQLPDAELDHNITPYLTTRRWIKERYAEWYNGSPDNSPLWQSRVLGEFPSAAANTLIPLSWLEQAMRPAVDSGDDIIIGIDVSGPGKDRTVAIACCRGAILGVGVWTDSDARGPALAFIRQFDSRLRIVRVDSTGIGFYFAEHIRSAGYRTEGVNVGSAPGDRERFTNLKAERYWMLRERFQRGEISGLSAEMLAELAAITWIIDPAGRTAIEGKTEVKSLLGRSPDLAEALMIGIGDGVLPPIEWRAVPRRPPSEWDILGSDGMTPRERHALEDRAEMRRKARWGSRWRNSGF